MPIDTIVMNIANSFGFTTLLSIIIEGSESAVTAIIKDSTVPTSTPLVNRASAIGIVPNISAYIGIPIAVAKKRIGFHPILFPHSAASPL
jgi:hypothetical protein